MWSVEGLSADIFECFFCPFNPILKNYLEYLFENDIPCGAHRKGLHGPIPATE